MIIILLTLFLILITCIDYKTKIIPDGLTLLGIIIALHYQFYAGNIWQALLGIDAGIGIVWVMNCLRLSGLGGGDAKTFALIGSVLGWQITLATAILAWLIFQFFKCRLKERRVAYSPYILGALVIVYLWKNLLYLRT